LLAAACRPVAPPPAAVGIDSASATGWPAHDFARAAEAGQRVYRIDAAGSRVEIVVRRAGPLARFGHDHVVAVREAEGYLIDPAHDGALAELRFPVASLAVDSPDGRRRHQLDTEPGAEDIAGTKANLFESVLDPDRWPFIELTVDRMEEAGSQVAADVTFRVQGRSHSIRQSFSLDRGPSTVMIEGAFSLRQTELGLEPFSALGGGLKVADEMELHFRISGRAP
jgi:hypothetical protein